MWGLNPGEYYVNALTQNFNFGAGRGGPAAGARPDPAVAAAAGAAARSAAEAASTARREGSSISASATSCRRPTRRPTIPGVGSINESRPVTVAVGQELLDVNFNLLLVRTAQVTGTVTSADGSITYSGQVSLAPETGAARADAVSLASTSAAASTGKGGFRSATSRPAATCSGREARTPTRRCSRRSR